MEEIWNSVDKDIRDLFEELGLTEYFPDKITTEMAANHGKKGGKKDIPWCFIENVLNPSYESRSIFFEDQDTNVDEDQDDNGSEWLLEDDFDSETETSSADVEMYSFLDVAVAVLLCCDNGCKQLLAQKLHESDLSVPFVLPDITNKDKLVVHSWTLRGITQDMELATHIPIVSFVSVDGESIKQTKLLNTILVNEAHKPFLDIELEKCRMGGASVKRIFIHGLIEATLSAPQECTCQKARKCSCTFQKLILFLNLYRSGSDVKTQEELICRISTLVVIVVNTGKLAGNRKEINNIKEIITNSKQVLIVFIKDDEASLDECKKGIQELKEDITGAQVAILYHRGTGKRDSTDLIRGNMKKRINGILELKDVDKTSLKEHFENLNINNVRLDEDEI